MMVELFKKNSKYTTEDGTEKTATNFYVKCGDVLVPVNVVFFKGEDGKDSQYATRRTLMSSFAETLPAKENK